MRLIDADALNGYKFGLISPYAQNLFHKTINEAPTIVQEQRTGHWEFVQYDGNPNIGNWHCSECRTIIPHMPENTDNTPIYKWCPMCGAKMASPTGAESEE